MLFPLDRGLLSYCLLGAIMTVAGVARDSRPAWAGQAISCNGISLGQCLHQVELAYQVTIGLNPEIAAKQVQVTTAAPDPVTAVKDIFEATGGMVPAIEQENANKILSITVIDAKGQLFQPTLLGADTAAKAAAYTPKTPDNAKPADNASLADSDGQPLPPQFPPPVLPPENPDDIIFPASGDDPPLTLRELQIKAQEANLDDPNRIVEMPDNSDFPKMTERQINAIRERDALQIDDPNAVVGPDQPEGEVLTYKQILEIRKRDAELLKNQTEVVMPDGTTFPVGGHEKATTDNP
ncbi:MAG: hypothetical protein AAGU21_12495 [Solidesulfovibrio sp.]|uniref:hypothetical protein n=1 Tax=Solidesulfovibrio sp. TaxID=2910990 RepID=UPI003158D50B